MKKLWQRIPLLSFPLCCMALLADTAWAAGLTAGDALNIAGRQRMITQRITKAYVQIGIGANRENAEQQLRDGVVIFEAHLKRLKNFAPTPNISTALDKLDSLWTPFRRVALADPSKENARRLRLMDEELLHAAEMVVELIQDAAGSGYSPLINTAGRQRMLSQRLAKLYMLQVAGLGGPSVEAAIERAKNEFKGALNSLQAATENSPTIREELEKVAEQWIWLESSLDFETDAHYPLIVADASEKILLLMDAITSRYVRLSQP